MKWIIISCILCVFGCFKEFRPSESFVTDYLTVWKNFTDVQVNILCMITSIVAVEINK